MEIKPGYKQTEVGVIPVEWEMPHLREHLLQNATYGVVKAGVFQRNGVPMLRSGEIKNGTIIEDYPLISLEKSQEYARTILKKNDVVIALVGYPGETAVIPESLIGANISRAVGLLRPASNLRAEFLACYLNSPCGRKEFLRPSAGSAQIVVNLGALNMLRLPLPSLAEQQAIAGALGDADALIDSLERLLAKKRLLKQGAMQSLLTGKTRLPGFSGEWMHTIFASVVRHHAGNSALIKGKLPNSKTEGTYPGFSASGQDVWCHNYEFEGDAIIVSAVGSRCGKAFFASGKWCAIANTHVVWPNTEKVEKRYLNLFINDEAFWLKSGSGQPFVLFKQSFAREILLPPLAEQTAIAGVLSDMDADLAAVEAKLAKARALKQGMMQELLTGRIRLV